MTNRATPLKETIVKEYHSKDNKESAWLSQVDGCYHFLAYKTARKTKPCENVGTRNTKFNEAVEDKYNKFVKYAVKDYEERIKHQEQNKKDHKELLEQIKIGSIFSYSWGYDQTNYDFFQVIDLKGKSTLVLRKINVEKGPEDGFMTALVSPVKDDFIGEAFDKRTSEKHGKYLYFDYGVATIWQGDKKRITWYA